VRRSIAVACCVVPLSLAAVGSAAQSPQARADVMRVQQAIANAFEFLYALPSDTSAAAMGSWVLDTIATTRPADSSQAWRIVTTKLTDTGDALDVKEMTGTLGASPRELAAAMAEMQELEAKVSKAEAEAALDVRVALNLPAANVGASAHPGPPLNAVVKSATSSVLYRGHWNKVDDRDLGMTVERWVPGKLTVHFATEASRAIQSVNVTASGSDEMLDRLVREARWESLATLVR
jgi:hypothetical protein